MPCRAAIYQRALTSAPPFVQLPVPNAPVLSERPEPSRLDASEGKNLGSCGDQTGSVGYDLGTSLLDTSTVCRGSVAN